MLSVLGMRLMGRCAVAKGTLLTIAFYPALTCGANGCRCYATRKIGVARARKKKEVQSSVSAKPEVPTIEP